MSTPYIQVNGYLDERGQFLFKGETVFSPVLTESVPAWQLARALCGWDPLSFYGTQLRTPQGQSDARELQMSALDTMRMWSNPVSLRHLKIEWSADLERFRQLASALADALVAGRIVPTLPAPGHSPRWRPLDAHLFADMPEEDKEAMLRWLTAAVEECLLHPTVAPAWERVENSIPAWSKVDLFHDEDDWHIALGFREDKRPFRVGLQLVDPAHSSDDWELNVILQDKADKDALFSWRGQTSGSELPLAWQSHYQAIEREMGRWVAMFPWLTEGSRMSEALSSGFSPIRSTLTDDEAWIFLTDLSQSFRDAGIPVFVPAWWERVREHRARLKARFQSTVGSAVNPLLGLNATLAFDWRVALGDVELTEAEFRQLVDEKRRLVKVRGEWIEMNPTFVGAAKKAMDEARKRGLRLSDVLMDALVDSRQEVPESEDGEPRLAIEMELNKHLQEWVREVKTAPVASEVSVPEDFQGELRPYQQMGFGWLYALGRLGLGACLADDMGLGKTIQCIAYLLASKRDAANRKESRPSLLICPTSVLSNWQHEFARFAPSLVVRLHYGQQRSGLETFASDLKGVDVLITSYTLAQMDQEILSSVDYHLVCLDEAQNIKNAASKQAEAVKTFSSKHRIALTGTPMENRLTELWSIFDFINPGYLGTLSQFRQQFVYPIEKSRDADRIATLQKLIQPFLLRRLKTDPAVRLNLPSKTEAREYVPLTAEQASLYEGVLTDMLERIEQTTPMQRRGLILASLTRLKQICDHPALMLKNSTSASWRQRSAKLDRLLEMIQEVRSEGESCLVFTQFVSAGELILRACEEELGERPIFLHGGVVKSKRDELVDAFQNGRHGVFVLSLKAGGVGLNLTAATHVFHFDRWWNPAVESQATDRVYRIGQDKPVEVHKFVSLGTVEERIDEMLQNKTQLAEQVVGETEQWVTELSTDELKSLFALRRDWVDG
ncbi:DEAD/DEAH box helicase [Alicyclobacillus sp. SP_1]|uniref:DEAD/DEAH box helicase n=1 Tax=Alicyclobacillus sp. SP_1 TaxID=2942475 RepID=UPI0021577C86|nr:DEAD/DEAH box helicase [Alicyclobacillus sp. SP_1]